MDIAEAMKSISFRYYNKYPGFEGDEFEMLDNKVRHNFDVHGTFVFVIFHQVWYCEELLSLYSKLWPGRNYPAVMVIIIALFIF